VNCAALPVDLAEAELFGVRKGAFTGAHAASAGLFRAAHGGSLFLDEILELPSALQAKLLRALQEGRVRPVGETHDVAVDVRIIAATQEPLPRAVDEQRFRADLHARLDGLTIALPPLRQRREDIVPLFHFFAGQQGVGTPALDGRFVEALCTYDWPLNVRELQLLTRRLLSVHGDERELRRSHLPERMTSGEALTPVPEVAEVHARAPQAGSRRVWKKADDVTEFDSLVAALRHHGGSVAKAAAAVGLSRNRAYRVLSAHPEFSLNDLRHS
jgi:transcriptional regulator with PAS, ATPase and Fis domain